MAGKTRLLAGGVVQAFTTLRIDHALADDEAITIVSRPMDAVRLVEATPAFITLENTTRVSALVAVLAGRAQTTDTAHRFGLLDLLAGTLGADVFITRGKS